MPYADPVKARERGRRWRAANPVRKREYNRSWCAANPERRLEQERHYHAAHPEVRMIRDARRRAARYGVPCTLTTADVQALLAPMRCSATGLPLAHAKGGKVSPLSPSLDRIVPALGYVPGNVRLVCHRFNLLRGTDPVSHDYRHALRVLAETTHADDSAITRNLYQ